MPITLIWENEPKTLVRLEIDGKWGWRDLRQAVETVTTETAGAPYHCIMHYTDTVTVPADLLSIGRQTVSIIPPTLQTVVSVIGGNLILKTLGDAFHVFYGSRQRTVKFFTVRTLDDAYGILEREGVPTPLPFRPHL
jgi:hypothetical protein